MLLRVNRNEVNGVPLKNGHLTAGERAFVEHMANTGDQVYAASKAGYGTPRVRATELMGKPAVKAAVLQRADQILRDELLPLALATHKRLLTDKLTPAGAALGAVKLAYDRTLGVDEGKADKEPSEMTYDELTASIDTLRREQEARADQARDVTPEQVSEADASTVFD
jgi:hypothetical protein